MPSQVHKTGPTTPQMNLTPLIDVVFQLIIFFMLVNNIAAREVVPMIVPDLEDPQTREMADDNRIVVSVAPADHTASDRSPNPLMFSGTARYVQVGSAQRFNMDQLSEVTDVLRRRREANADVRVILRADQALHYKEVQPVMAAITAADIETVHLVAFMPGRAPLQGSNQRASHAIE